MLALEYHMKIAAYHIEQADKWLALYDGGQTSTRKVLMEHHIDLAKHHVFKAIEAKEVLT